MRRLTWSAVAVISATLLMLGGPAASAQVPGPNGQIAFAREIPRLEDTATFAIDPDGTDQRRLLDGPSGGPHWSPDGSEIALASCQNPPGCTTAATIVDPETGDVLRWFDWPDPELFTSCIIWSPDGYRLACESFGEPDPDRNGIYSIDASDGTDLRRITSNPGGDDMPGDYSPDGTQIVFLRIDPDRREGRNQALFTAQVDGSGAVRITPWGASDEAGEWSPDGATILFARGGTLYTVPADGGDISRVRLGTRGGAFDPVWSPNGRRIAFGFFTQGERQSDIWIARTDGRGMERVTDTRRSEHFPDWGTHPTT